MMFKTVQWNIGGGKLSREGTDRTLLSSYTVDGLDKIIDFLRQQNPDVITLQETHASKGYCQPQIIAEALGYKGWINDKWADSHVEAGQRLGQGIVSRYPIKDHSFEWFTNPNFKAIWEDGTVATSHDKGRTRCKIDLGNGKSLLVQTLHTIPFRRFNIEITSKAAHRVLQDMADRLVTKEPGVLQADFNIDAQSLRPLFPGLFEAGFQEVEQLQPTSVRGQHFDHVLYLGMKVDSCRTVTDVLTDKYPIVTTFDLD